MPNPPAQPATILSTQVGFTAGGGAELMPEPTQVQTLPSQPPPPAGASSTPLLIGFDAAQFSISLTAGVGVQVVTFPNLPYRNNTTNPLAPNTNAGLQTYTPQPIDLLMIDVSLQNLIAMPGTVVSVSGQALNAKGLAIVGPFLGHDKYITFQAAVSVSGGASSGFVSGFVVARLYLSKG